MNRIARALARFGLATIWLASATLAAAQQPALRKDSDTAIANRGLRLYMSPIRVDSAYRLTPNGYAGGTHIEQSLGFPNGTDSARVPQTVGTVGRSIETWNGVHFVSPQLAGPFELNGHFSGRLELITNKQDFDFQISLYEQTSSGDFVLISMYSTESGAARDSSHRTPLQPGVRQYVDYQSDHLAGRVIQNGSRLVVLITILEQPAIQTRLRTPRDAGEAAIADANAPLRISWYGGSYIELQVNFSAKIVDPQTPKVAGAD